MASVNATIGPSFTLTVQQGANPIIACTIYDRAGNVLNLTGFTVKLAAKKFVRKSNGVGQITNQEIIKFDLTATITGPTSGNVTFAIPPSNMQIPGIFDASLRMWNSGVTQRNPDDAYAGSFVVEAGVVRVES